MFGRKQPNAQSEAWPESPVAYTHDGPSTGSNEEIDPDSGVKRGLKNRHLSMMALAGIIGPGLLVGAGGALQNPLGKFVRPCYSRHRPSFTDITITRPATLLMILPSPLLVVEDM